MRTHPARGKKFSKKQISKKANINAHTPSARRVKKEVLAATFVRRPFTSKRTASTVKKRSSTSTWKKKCAR